MSDYRDLGIMNTALALCINCGFIGATLHVNGIGPYCGKCAEHAGPPRYFESPEPTQDPPDCEKCSKVVKASNLLDEYLKNPHRCPIIVKNPENPDKYEIIFNQNTLTIKWPVKGYFKGFISITIKNDGGCFVIEGVAFDLNFSKD